MPRDTRAARAATDSELVLGTPDASLLDVVDNVLNKGVVLSGDLTIALAQVDLIYARLSLLLCAADRVLPNEDADFTARHHARHMMRVARKRAGLSRRITPRAGHVSRPRAPRTGG